MISLQTLRRLFWAVIVESKSGLGEETTFEFKYIPDFSKRTKKEELGLVKPKRSVVERRNLQAIVIACCLLMSIGYAGMKVLRYICQWWPMTVT